jgi:hypothetical protein
MNATWQTETGHLACRWSDLLQHVPHNPGWLQDGIPTGAEPAAPCYLDFRRFSGSGGRRWLEPDPGYGC